MRRFLFVLILFGAIVMILRRLAGAFAPAKRHVASERPGTPRPAASQLVRDRICNTFLPKDRAIAIETSGEVQYFCSEACRARAGAAASRATDAA